MTGKRHTRAVYRQVYVSVDVDRPIVIQGCDERDPERFVAVHMTRQEMVAARDSLTELIDNPPDWLTS
ncbi:hypothetical protein [Streptomyces sp. NPDC094472]|uniref:hypothetical protein n=1 Tax=unclassified Streptomyces TaxID=2593676 RepID=UPI00332B0D78